MKYLVIVLFLAGLVYSKRPTEDDVEEDEPDVKDVHFRPQFTEHVRKYGASRQNTRNNQEVKERYKMFKRSAKQIQDHNRGSSRYRLRANHFMTMSQAERKLRTGLANVTSTVHKRSLSATSRLQLRDVAPETFDHRNYDRVSPVVDQGECGSCWSYATVYPLEAAVAMLSDKPAVALSVQEILSCTYEDDKDRNGCEGGWYMDGWDYVKKNGRLATDAESPYLEMDMTCEPGIEKTPNAFKDYNIVNWDRVPMGDDASLLLFSSKHVLAIAIESLGLFFYGDGLFEDEYCETPAAVDHAMTMVGYDKEAWIVKNSWGEEWGNLGYLKMSRGLENHCGISDYAYFPIVEKKKEEKQEEEKEKKKGRRKKCFYY